MSSIARQIRRGTRDAFGTKLQKRPFNNRKRTKGRQAQSDNQERYRIIMERARYINKLSKLIIADEHYLTKDNWLEIVRKYDEKKMFFDTMERDILFNLVNRR